MSFNGKLITFAQARNVNPATATAFRARVGAVIRSAKTEQEFASQVAALAASMGLRARLNSTATQLVIQVDPS